MRRTYQRLDGYFRRRTPQQILLRSLIFVLILGAIDLRTGFEISLSFFYLIPIAIATLYSGFRNGLIITTISTFIWAVSNRLAMEPVSSEWIRYWNTGIRFATFSLVSYLLHQLNLSIQLENQLARTDFLTGAKNAREFYRLVGIEMERARQFRHGFSIAYLDLDNFKLVNDYLGHSAGDDLLRQVAQTVTEVVRKGDVFARLGGDEFALFLPGTDGETVRGAIEKVRAALVDKVQAAHKEVTVSIGTVTFLSLPDSVDEVIRVADKLMYEVKSNGKDGVIYKVEGQPLDK